MKTVISQDKPYLMPTSSYCCWNQLFEMEQVKKLGRPCSRSITDTIHMSNIPVWILTPGHFVEVNYEINTQCSNLWDRQNWTRQTAHQIHLYQHLHPIREKPDFHLFCFSPILHLAPYQDHLVGHGTNFLIVSKKFNSLKKLWHFVHNQAA